MNQSNPYEGTICKCVMGICRIRFSKTYKHSVFMRNTARGPWVSARTHTHAPVPAAIYRHPGRVGDSRTSSPREALLYNVWAACATRRKLVEGQTRRPGHMCPDETRIENRTIGCVLAVALASSSSFASYIRKYCPESKVS